MISAGTNHLTMMGMVENRPLSQYTEYVDRRQVGARRAPRVFPVLHAGKMVCAIWRPTVGMGGGEVGKPVNRI